MLTFRRLLVLTLTFAATLASYIPELLLTTSSEFFNKQLSVNVGPMISKLANNFTISDFTYDDKYDGFKVKLNLTNIKQNVQINWNANVLNVTSEHNFSLLSKNINATLKGDIEFKVGALAKQKGQITIEISQLEVNSYHQFQRSPCVEGSIGFNLNVVDLLIDSSKFNINIKGKTIDNVIINLLKSILKSRIPNIINTTGKQLINSAINSTTCFNPLQEVIPVGTETYVFQINTTDVPYFADRRVLTIPLDINLQNEVTNASNEEVQNQNLVDEHVYEDKADATLTLSSNMIDTVLWLVDDSNLLSVCITNQNLGPNPPLSLDTEGLSIVIPSLKQLGKKEIILRINTSSEYSELFIRSGRFLSAVSISVDLIINDTGKVPDVKECLAEAKCYVASQLNVTLGLSASARAQKFNFWEGLLQSIHVYDIQVIESIIDVDVQNLKKIVNSLLTAQRPLINKALQEGVEFSPEKIDMLKKFNLTGIIGQPFMDYASVGLLFDL